MLRDEIDRLNKLKKEELAKEEEKRQLKLERKKQSALYQFQQRRKERREQKEQVRYDKETEKIIQAIPERLKKKVKEGLDCTDIYEYDVMFIVHPYLSDFRARTYLDQRGKDILAFLEKEGIHYELCANNYALMSYFSIRVYFEKKKPYYTDYLISIEQHRKKLKNEGE